MVFGKIKKLLVVTFLTILIWGGAYLALEKRIEKPAVLQVSFDTSPDILVTFADGDTTIPLLLTLKGPAAKIAELEKKWSSGQRAGEEFNFFYNAETQRKTAPGTYSLDISQFLSGNSEIKAMGLAIESCLPETVDVTVEKLVEKELTIEAFDENGSLLGAEIIEPSAKMKMFVPQSWSGDLLKAKIQLTASEVEMARKDYITKTPHIMITPEVLRKGKLVKVKLPSTDLQDRVLQPTIGYILSKNLKTRYNVKFTVQLLNENDLRTIHLRATDEAWEAYDKRTPYQVLVEIKDGDEKTETEISREIVYNFPPEYVRKKEIEYAGSVKQAKFKLIPITAETE